MFQSRVCSPEAPPRAVTIQETLYRYMRSSPGLRPDASWLMATIVDEQQAAGLDDRARASIKFMLLWTASLNIYFLTHWILAHALTDPTIHSLILEETAPAFSPTTHDLTNQTHIRTSCPRFSVLHTELLRQTMDFVSIRTVEHPITSSGGSSDDFSTPVVLGPGGIVTVLLHYNDAVFVENAEGFDADRFVQPISLPFPPFLTP